MTESNRSLMSSTARLEHTSVNAAPGKTNKSAICSLGDFLRLLFRLLEEFHIRYCVLHGWEALPDHVRSDLDLAVHANDRAKLAAVFGVIRDRGFLPVNCHCYEVNGYSFFFCWFYGTGHSSVIVDVIFEYRDGGLILISGEDLIVGRRRQDSFWIPNPAVALQYLLAKKTLKGIFSSYQQEQIKNLVKELGRTHAEKVTAKLYGERWKKRVIDACLGGTLQMISKQLVWRLRRTVTLRNPLIPVRYFFGNSIRLIRRWFQPAGVFVVILGPDGAGKSTLAEKLLEKAGAGFRWQRVFHWRPQTIVSRPDKGPVTNPHGAPVRGPLGAIPRLAVFFADYWIGYLLVIRPLLARSGLIIFDRYFHDIAVDNKRYRYGGPLWLPRILAYLVPSPDLFLILDAEEEVILSRKREVEPEELKRLRLSYIALASEIFPSVLIKTNEGIEESSAAAFRAIARQMAERFERWHGFWLPNDKSNSQSKPAEVARP